MGKEWRAFFRLVAVNEDDYVKNHVQIWKTKVKGSVEDRIDVYVIPSTIPSDERKNYGLKFRNLKFS